MQIPMTVAFEGLEESDAVQKEARDRAADLERFSDRITPCRVVIARPHHHGRQGGVYCVRIDLTVPGEEIVVNREHRFDERHEDVFVAMRDAFHAARRQLEDHVRRVRGQVKAHGGPARGRVAKLFPREGYGFISTPEGREVYFQRESIVGGDFEHVRIGDELWFAEESGEKGPQASSVHLAHRDRLGHSRARSHG
jgi:cold shock CspA family protein